MGPAVRAIGRVLVHEALAIFAADLCDLLLRHLTLWRHPVSWHRLTVARIHWLTVSRIGIVSRIVSRIVSGRAITLLHGIYNGHVALHWLWHDAWREKCNL